ncbi:MAG: D-alanine--D-alanine ligase [Microbacteriaceae bacterium]|nr:D-alanine--D-alanine ligase [Microbacteriaceae bacterium]HEV7955628.1 D-alanine--D-alanine ligase family protein [Marisediminicola sp.]
MQPQLVIAVLFGGRSSEHSISCATAGGVLSAIDRTKYRVIPIGITSDGAFTLQPDDAEAYALDADVLPVVQDNGTRVHWPDSAESRELAVSDETGTRSLGDIDVVFPILHGRFGEDGTVQGMLELLGLPYVGAGVLSSAVGMDKHFTKTVLQHSGIAVAPWQTVTAHAWGADPAAVTGRITAQFDWPVFVKPARAGSSVGVSKASDADELASAIQTALAQDTKVLVEATLVGREIECAVLAGRDGAPPRVSVAGEIVTPAGSFYDFEAKYLASDGAALVCPAEISAAQLAQMQDIAARAFLAIDGTGLARVDFFLTASGFVVNELNTMPGFTPISMFPKCWLASGMSYPELLDELIDLGISTAR